jgi:phosphate-selective porin OprO/OprP
MDPPLHRTRGRALAYALAAAIGLSALAPPARGEPAEPAEPATEEPAPEAGEGAFDFDLGWDHGLTYEYRQRLLVLDRLGAPTWIDEVALEGRIGGSLSLDGGWVGGTGVDDDGLEGSVRRARVFTRGELHFLASTGYKFEFALDDGRFFLNDFYLRWQPDYVVDTLRFGYFDPPATLQNLVASSSRVLMEVAAPVAAFAPGFRLGVDVGRAHQRPSLSWYVSASSVGQEMEVGDASDEPLRLYGRLVWRPLGAPDPERDLLHVGASSSWSPDTGSTTIRYRSRPETYLTDYAVDTGDIDGSANVLGLEAAWRHGPLILQMESLMSRVDADAGGSPFFYGAYLQVNRALTGEVRGYDTGVSTFRRLVPAREMSLRGGGLGGLGGLELAGRVSWLDVSDDGVNGGRMLSLTVGPAWTWNRFVRVQANYGVARVRDRPDEGTQHIAQARLEIAF